MSGRSNWLRFGPVVIRIGSRHLASWGFPRLEIGGLSIWSGNSDGSLCLASYHPRSSFTWLWSVTLTRGKARTGRFLELAPRGLNRGQWHHYVNLPIGWMIRLSRQHRMEREP